MKYAEYYNSNDNNLYSDYMSNCIDSNSMKGNIRHQKNNSSIYKLSIMLNNNKNNLNKNQMPYNNSKNNTNLQNNTKKDYLVYKSHLKEIKNNTSNISNNNNALKNDEYLYKTFNNTNDNYLNNLIIKKNRNDINNYNYIPNNNNQKLLSQSINKYDSSKNNNTNIIKYSISNNKSLKKSNTNKYYSSTDSFYKSNNNLSNKQKNKKYTQDKNNYNILENENEINNNKGFMDKNEFFKNIKEIQDLDSIEIDSSNIGMEFNINMNMNNDFFLKENKNDNDIKDEPIIDRNTNTLKKYNKTTNNIDMGIANINKYHSEKMENNSNYNRISINNKTNKENKGNNKILLSKINTEKKQNLKYSKKASEKLISNLTDNKRNNYLNNIDFHESFSNSNIKRENLNYYYNFENDENNFDISENYNSNNKLIKDNSSKNSINNIFEKKFSDKLNISPYKKRFSTLTNNDIDENGSKNEEIIDQVINDKNDDNLYNNLIDFKNKNIN